MWMHAIALCLVLPPAAPPNVADNDDSITIAMTEPELDAFRYLCSACALLTERLSEAGQRLLVHEDAARIILVSDDGHWQFRTNDYQLRSDKGKQGDAKVLKDVLAKPGVAEFLCLKRNEVAVMSGVGRRDKCTIKEALRSLSDVKEVELANALRMALGAVVAGLDTEARGVLMADAQVGDAAKLSLGTYAATAAQWIEDVLSPEQPRQLASEDQGVSELASALDAMRSAKIGTFIVTVQNGISVARFEHRPGVVFFLTDRSPTSPNPTIRIDGRDWYLAATTGHVTTSMAMCGNSHLVEFDMEHMAQAEAVTIWSDLPIVKSPSVTPTPTPK